MNGVLVSTAVILFPDAGIHFGTICKIFQFVQLGYVDELPLHQVVGLVEKIFLFFLAGELGFVKGMQFVFCMDEPELFIELCMVFAIAANDAIHQFCKIPFHNRSIYKVKTVELI